MNIYKLALISFLIISSQVFSQVNTLDTKYIINQIVNNTNNNNLNNCEFTAYNKSIVTANPDLIDGKIDSIFEFKKNKQNFVRLDSTDYY
jgi:hypothetical protein